MTITIALILGIFIGIVLGILGFRYFDEARRSRRLSRFALEAVRRMEADLNERIKAQQSARKG